MSEFQKYKIRLPDIDDSCTNGNCKHKHDYVLSNAPETPSISAIPTTQPPAAPAASEHDHSKHDIRTNHQELAELMPRGVNFAKCADGSCGNSIIKNSKITKKFKKCTNCNSNGVPSKSDICPTCGIKEPTEEDEKESFWDESEIESDKIGEDED